MTCSTYAQTMFGERYTIVWPGGNAVERDHWSDRGLMHMELGEYSEASTPASVRRSRSTLRQAAAWTNLARARLRLWQYNEALQAVEEGIGARHRPQ